MSANPNIFCCDYEKFAQQVRYTKILVLSIVYHGLGGVVSSFQDSGIIILRVIDTAPPEALTSIELKKTSNRTLNKSQNHRKKKIMKEYSDTSDFIL